MNEPFLSDRQLRDALLLAARAEYAPRPGEEQPQIPVSLRRRMRPLLADPFGRRKRRRQRMGRAAVAAVLALTVSLGGLIALSPEARAWVQRIVIQLQDRYATVRFHGDSPAGGLGNWAPTWLPDGYELTEIYDPYEKIRYLTYENAEGLPLFVTSTVDSNFTSHVDNEHHIEEYISINGNDAYLLRAIVPGHENSVYWFDETANTGFCVMGYLPVDTLIKIAESIEKN